MERRLPAALAAFLVVLCVAAAPAAAAPPVTFDQASGSAQANAGSGAEGDTESETGPSISVSANFSNQGADGSASMDATFAGDEDGFTIVYRASVAANGDPNTGAGGIGQTNLGSTVLARARVPYRVTVTASGTGLFRHSVSFHHAQFEEGETGVKTGMLDLNDLAQFNAGAQCGTGFMVNQQCTGTTEVRVEIGEPTPPVVIGSGPSGVVGSRSATFQFTTLDASPPPGRFECSLDGGTFTPCASPLELSQLAEGEHVLRVRYHPDGQEPSEPAERRWTVDTTPPVVSFGSAPSGGGHPADTTITFSANEPASFRCSLDGGPAVDCSSPHDLRALAVGIHDFTVEATDAAGNASDQIRTEWEVIPPPPPPAGVTCAAGQQSQVAFGPIIARGCFAPETVGSRQALVSRGPVSVNGIRVAPHTGSRIAVDPALAGGSVRAIGPVTISPGDLQLGWTLEDGFNFDGLVQGGITTANRAIALEEGLLTLAALPVTGALQFELSPDNGGQARITARVTLPRASFSALPGGLSPAGQGLTVEVPITVSNDQGLTGGVRLKLAEAHLFGRIKVKDLDLFYDHTIRTFEGSAGVKLSPRGLTLTIGVAIGPDGLIGPLRRLFFQASSLNRPVGYGIFVQRFGAGLERATDPDGHALARFSGTAGVSLGPRVSIGSFEIEAMSLDGTVTLDVPTGPQPPEPFSLAVGGALKVVDVPLVNGRVRYVPPTRVEIAGMVDYTLFGYGIAGELANDPQGRPLSWVSPDGFNLEVRGQAGFPGLGRTDPATAVLSTLGWAVCIGPDGDRVGFGRRWDDELQPMSDSCDVGPFRETAVASQAGEPGVTIRRGTRLAVLSARGDGAPPKVVVTGPGGERFETPAGPEGVRDNGNLLVQDPRTNTTFVVLRNPAPGRWSVTGAVTRLDVAEGLPPVRVKARVRGKGARRTLSWNAGPLPFGQRLTFVERGTASANVLRTTARRRGRLTFTPDPGPGRARRIEVVVTRNGMPRLDRVVARFTAPSMRVGKVKRLRIRGRMLTWRHQPGLRYEVAIARGGALTNRSVARPRIRLPRGRVRVTIVAVDAHGRVGPPARLRR